MSEGSRFAFTPGTLARRIAETEGKAVESGELQPIATRSVLLEDAEGRFLVRVLEGLSRKRGSDSENRKRGVNPFLPYEEAMFVADISKTHVAILNKFPVLSHHLLAVTRRFEEQESLLTEEDFQAMWIVLHELDPLFFYNAGPLAGASQRHKHLQAVPLPLDGGSLRLPKDLGFPHHRTDLGDCRVLSVDEAARATRERYLRALSAIGRGSDPRAYNLLATAEWMFLAPRTRESFRGISVNSLAFAGAFLVEDEEELELLREIGPSRILKEVTT